MKVRNLYLKRNVLVEPLFNQWYAWSNLIAPATSAMYVANLHLKIMQSFVTSPQVHVAALKNPANLGGPYINYGTDRANEIKALLERTQKEQAHIVEFAEAIKPWTPLSLKKRTAFRSNRFTGECRSRSRGTLNSSTI